MIAPKCMRCGDLGVVGGFMPAPCPGCRVYAADPLQDEVDRLGAKLSKAEADHAEQQEDHFRCAAIAEECGFLPAMGPSDAVRSLANAYEEACDERDAYRSMVCDLLASAHPNNRDHPSMSRQWARARHLLKTGELQPNASSKEQP